MPPVPQNGRARIVYNSGDLYTGKRVKGKREGKGTYRWVDGNWYEGDWKDDRKSGHGTWHSAAGDVYEGEWANDKREGQGTWQSGTNMIERYEGQWKDGKRCGQGKSTTASGDVYEGEWSANARFGFGTCTYKDGHSYTGYWANGVKAGVGTLHYASGNADIARWEQNKLVEGVRWLPDRMQARRLSFGRMGDKLTRAEAAAKSQALLDSAGLTKQLVPPLLPLSLRPFTATISGWVSIDGHTVFTLNSSVGGREYTSQRRTSDFLKLHATLSAELPDAKLLTSALPSRLVPNLSRWRPARMAMLQQYLHSAVTAADAQPSYPAALLSFLNIEPQPGLLPAARHLRDAILQADLDRATFLLSAGADANAMVSPRRQSRSAAAAVALAVTLAVALTVARAPDLASALPSFPTLVPL